MPTSPDETPSTGVETHEKGEVEVKSERSTEKGRNVRPLANRSKSLSSLSDSKFIFPPHQRLSRRKTEGGGIRVVWRTLPTAELDNLSRILGIPARNRSISPMKRPEPVDQVFSEYYDPLAFHTRIHSNSQETTTSHIYIPTAKRRNTRRKDSVAMPSVKKLLSIFERSATSSNDAINPKLDSKEMKEHHIKFAKTDKHTRLTESIPGIINEVYGQYKSKDYSEAYEDSVEVAQKPKIGLVKTNSLPNHEIESRSQNENNNSNNLSNLNNIDHEKEIINSKEVPLRYVDGKMYLESKKVARPTTSVSLLKQKWESFVSERTKSKKSLKPDVISAFDSPVVLPTKQPEESLNENAFYNEFHRHHTDTFRRSVPLERNTTSRRSVKNLAKKYESMRQSSSHSKETSVDNKVVEGRKKIQLTPSKSLDNIKLLEKTGDPWIVEINLQDEESLESRKEITVSKINVTESVILERKPSVRDLKKKFEESQNYDQLIVNRTVAKKDLIAGLSPVEKHETEILDLNNCLEEVKINKEKDTFGDEINKYSSNVNEQIFTDSSIHLLDTNTKPEENIATKDPDTPIYENNLNFDDTKIKESNANTEFRGPKTPTKKSSIKIELSLSPPNPQRKSKLSIMPVSDLVDDEDILASTINSKISYPHKVDAEHISSNVAGTKERVVKNRFPKKEYNDQSKETKALCVNLRGEVNSSLVPDTKQSKSAEMETVNENFALKLSASESPSIDSDVKSKSVKTVLVTELRSPTLSASAVVGKRKVSRFNRNKSEDLTVIVDNSKICEPISKTLMKESIMAPNNLNNSEIKKQEGLNDSASSKVRDLNEKISDSDIILTTINTDNEVKVMKSKHVNAEKEIKHYYSTENKISDVRPNVDNKHHHKETVNEGHVSEQSSPEISITPDKNYSNADNLTDKFSGTNVNKIESAIIQPEDIQPNPNRSEPPVPSERTKYLTNPTNVPVSSYCTIYNSSSDCKSKLTSEVMDEQAIHSKDPKVVSGNFANENVTSDNINQTNELNGTNNEESLTKDSHRGGSKFRSRKAARRAYTDSLLKHLVKSDASSRTLECSKESEVAHPNELYNLLYRKNLQDPSQEAQSADAAVNKTIPPFLVRKTRSKSATSMTLFNKVRELKPDELKFFKDLTPVSVYYNNSVVTKDRASSIATSSPTSSPTSETHSPLSRKSSYERSSLRDETQSQLSRKSSFERSSLRDSQKCRKLHSDEMKFFGLNYTSN